MKKTITKQTEVRARQRAHGDSLREWLQGRAAAAAKRIRDRRDTPPTRSRGVDRVPARYRAHAPAPEVLVEVPASARAGRTAKTKPGRPLPRLREQRAARLEYTLGETALDEKTPESTTRRWTR